MACVECALVTVNAKKSTGTSGINIGNGSITSLGTLFLTGSGTQVVPPGVVAFEIFINQTTPSIGSGSFIGSIFGTVMTGPGGNVALETPALALGIAHRLNARRMSRYRDSWTRTV